MVNSLTLEKREKIMVEFGLRPCGYTGPLGRFGLVNERGDVFWHDKKYLSDERLFRIACSVSH